MEWLDKFLPGEEQVLIEEDEVAESIETGDGLPTPEPSEEAPGQEARPTSSPWQGGTSYEEYVRIENDLSRREEVILANQEQIAQNQQRVMQAVDNLASSLATQMSALMTRVIGVERMIEQKDDVQFTNLMFDAPEVFDEVMNRPDSGDGEDILPPPPEAYEQLEEVITPVPSDDEAKSEGVETDSTAVDPPSSEPEIPDNVREAFEKWQNREGKFQDFVKAAGGPVHASKFRQLLDPDYKPNA